MPRPTLRPPRITHRRVSSPVSGTLTLLRHTHPPRTHSPSSDTLTLLGHALPPRNTHPPRTHSPFSDTLTFLGHTHPFQTYSPSSDTLSVLGHTHPSLNTHPPLTHSPSSGRASRYQFTNSDSILFYQTGRRRREEGGGEGVGRAPGNETQYETRVRDTPTTLGTLVSREGRAPGLARLGHRRRRDHPLPPKENSLHNQRRKGRETKGSYSEKPCRPRRPFQRTDPPETEGPS